MSKKLESLSLTPRETRSKRINLVIRPSVYDKLAKVRDNTGVSMNDLFNRVMEAYLDDNAKKLGL